MRYAALHKGLEHLARELGENGGPVPELKERGELVCRHYEDMLSHYGAIAGMRMARKHVGWYTKGLPKSAEFRAKVNSIPEPADVLTAIDEFYTPLCDRTLAA